MMADLVEQAGLKTGRRAEGVFFSAATFIRKLVTGIGVSAAGYVLWFAHFPKVRIPAHVPADALWRLGAFYVPTIFTLWMTMVAVITIDLLDRKRYTNVFAELRRRRSSRDVRCVATWGRLLSLCAQLCSTVLTIVTRDFGLLWRPLAEQSPWQ